jgi:hypothetical protein
VRPASPKPGCEVLRALVIAGLNPAIRRMRETF